MNRRSVAALAWLLCLAFSGCGQKGPLYLPTPPKPPSVARPSVEPPATQRAADPAADPASAPKR